MEKLRRACFERDGRRCRICSKPLTWETMHMAHIIDRSKGGPDTLDNVRALCAVDHMREHANGLPLRYMHL